MINLLVVQDLFVWSDHPLIPLLLTQFKTIPDSSEFDSLCIGGGVCRNQTLANKVGAAEVYPQHVQTDCDWEEERYGLQKTVSVLWP